MAIQLSIFTVTISGISYIPRMAASGQSERGSTIAMRRTSRVIAALLVASLAVAPVFVPDGRPGREADGGASMGSRGSRTFSAPPATNTAPGGGTTIQRSMTPQAAPQLRSARGRGTAGGLSRGGAFTSGLLGGLIGARHRRAAVRPRPDRRAERLLQLHRPGAAVAAGVFRGALAVPPLRGRRPTGACHGWCWRRPGRHDA